MNLGFLPSDGGSSRRQVEIHLEKLQEPAKSIMIDLRNFVLSLGSNVIEEVRPHRVIYAKTLTFRTFLDVEPAVDHLIVEIRAGRQSETRRIIINSEKEAEQVKPTIAEAYESVR